MSTFSRRAQKYQCRSCNHQFAPDRPMTGEGQTGRQRHRSYPSCPRCRKASFVHHDYEHYINYRCTDKHCSHSFFVVKGTAVSDASMSELFGKTSFKRMRYPVFVIITVLTICFTSVKALSAISASFFALHLISRSHIPPSVTGVQTSRLYLTT